jgi:hypothetical protein
MSGTPTGTGGGAAARATAASEAAARAVACVGCERGAAAAAAVERGAAAEHWHQKEVAAAAEVAAAGARVVGTFLPTTPPRWPDTLDCHNRRPTDLRPSRTLATAQDSFRGLVAAETEKAVAAAAERAVAAGADLEAAGRSRAAAAAARQRQRHPCHQRRTRLRPCLDRKMGAVESPFQ